MKSATRPALLSLGLVLFFSVSAHAQRLERTFPAGENSVVEVRNLNGQILVRAWNQPQVKVVAVRNSLAVETHLEQAANRIHVHTHLLQASVPAVNRMVDYEIWAPASTRLQLHLEAGNLEVEDFTDDVTIETVAAEVRLRHLRGYTTAQSLNGSIYAERCSGYLEARSISGSLHFQESETQHLVANTTSGDILYEGALRPGGSYEFVNHEGEIELRLPASASFELNARSVEGEVIASEFPFKRRKHGRVAPRSPSNNLLGTVHAGEAMVRATSFSGTIRVRKQ